MGSDGSGRRRYGLGNTGTKGSRMINRTMMGLVLVASLSAVGIAHASKNGANDYLLSQSPSGQAALLGKVVGRGCVGKSVFYMGMGPTKGTRSQAFWSVKCANGATYAVEVNPDGTNQALECTAFAINNVGKCFKKLPGN